MAKGKGGRRYNPNYLKGGSSNSGAKARRQRYSTRNVDLMTKGANGERYLLRDFNGSGGQNVLNYMDTKALGSSGVRAARGKRISRRK